MMTFPQLRRILFLTGGVIAVAIFICGYQTKPRVLAINEVPVVFWSWRTNAPTQSEVDDAREVTNAKILFLRAGQFDHVNGKVKRIREVGGSVPDGVEIHLVYNATRRLLQDLDTQELSDVAEKIISTYSSDVSHLSVAGENVHGLQLDFDVPNRLLPRYGAILRSIRERIPSNIKLSVTGLPTWTTTPDDLKTALEAVDFWIPQCYGGKVPTNLNERIPIASASDVERTIKAVRNIGKPFYAGLAAYGYAILYSKEGDLLELRGNVDPFAIADSAGLELIDRSPFVDGEEEEIRYEYRAIRDVVIDGLIVEPGQTVVVDQPSSASLRSTARVVRENAGEALLGIAIFRLPSASDDTALTIREIAAALNDTQTITATELQLQTEEADGLLRFSVRNTGTASSLLGVDAFAIDIAIPAGRFQGVSSMIGLSGYEALCRRNLTAAPEKCSPQRADVVRLHSSQWNPGDNSSFSIDLGSELPRSMHATVTTTVDDGRIIAQHFELKTDQNEKTDANHTPQTSAP